MVASAKISDKSIHPQELKQTKGTFLPYIGPQNWLSLMLQKYGCVHLVPHVILHLMKYWLLIFSKNGGPCRAVEAELDLAKKHTMLFIAS